MAELKTNAEKFADRTRDLANFKNFSLPGVKEQVEVALKTIGRVGGIFSTYTLHDISHIEAMLEMLDWIIPPETLSKMTDVDWLLIVLAIYFHDMGMMVSKEELVKRIENIEFLSFKESIEKDVENKDYLSRLLNLVGEEKEAFIYQEFIRKNHAVRIREWINGNASYFYGDSVKPIVEAVGKMLSGLPIRFKKNLADICESHHKDNLDDKVYFPLCEKYGIKEMANVQYAAVVLRTVDLLHITKDRAPSVMFKTIGVTDPMGIDEWKKQMGTYLVNLKARKYNPKDPNTQIIKISADFNEEKPFFLLSEYVVYSNNQLLQSRRWIEQSSKDPDGENYIFP